MWRRVGCNSEIAISNGIGNGQLVNTNQENPLKGRVLRPTLPNINMELGWCLERFTVIVVFPRS